jgi:hypothetical protein
MTENDKKLLGLELAPDEEITDATLDELSNGKGEDDDE